MPALFQHGLQVFFHAVFKCIGRTECVGKSETCQIFNLFRTVVMFDEEQRRGGNFKLLCHSFVFRQGEVDYLELDGTGFQFVGKLLVEQFLCQAFDGAAGVAAFLAVEIKHFHIVLLCHCRCVGYRFSCLFRFVFIA